MTPGPPITLQLATEPVGQKTEVRQVAIGWARPAVPIAEVTHWINPLRLDLALDS
jgi:hypothetical protein